MRATRSGYRVIDAGFLRDRTRPGLGIGRTTPGISRTGIAMPLPLCTNAEHKRCLIQQASPQAGGQFPSHIDLAQGVKEAEGEEGVGTRTRSGAKSLVEARRRGCKGPLHASIPAQMSVVSVSAVAAAR